METCNQYGKQMKEVEFGLHFNRDKICITVCANPACPSFALLQLSEEQIDNLLINKKKGKK